MPLMSHRCHVVLDGIDITQHVASISIEAEVNSLVVTTIKTYLTPRIEGTTIHLESGTRPTLAPRVLAEAVRAITIRPDEAE